MRAQLFEITHTTVYRYASPVSVSHNLLRLAPRNLPCQHTISHALEIGPLPSVTQVHTDYFGNEVQFATIAETHQELRVVARSQVALGPTPRPDPSETPSWETVGVLCHSDRSQSVMEAAEFTFASPHVPVASPFAEYAEPSFTPRRPILEAVIDLTGRIHRDFIFDPAATTVATPLEEVLQLRRGVCQDFAHFEIACLRALGLPARYVSGYLETRPPPGQQKLAGVDASHAWISLYCPGMGWIDVDPTNNLLPSMQHITVAWGRDYADVCPIRGVVSGGGEAPQMEVAVDVLAQGSIEMGALANGI
jgi:transglutaminase-like putative cysteine protease